jgi:hypothetical protein
MFASFAKPPIDFTKLRFFNGLSFASYVDSADLKRPMEKPPIPPSIPSHREEAVS